MAEEIGPVAIIRPAADEEGLDAGPLAALGDGDDVGILQVLHIDVLACLDAAQRADAVAPDGGSLEFQLVGGGVHALGIVALDRGRFAGQEAPRLVHLPGIILAADKIDARPAAALDLILQAGAGAGAEHRIRTGAQHEGARQVGHRPVHRAGRGEGAEIVTLAGLAATMLLQLAERVVAGEQDLRQALVVAKQDVVARLQLLDQVRFQKQRLDLRAGDDHLQRLGLADHPHQPVRQPVRLGIAGHAPRQVARLADIERLAGAVQHAVDPGVAGQLPHFRFQIGETAAEVRRQVGRAGGSGGLVMHGGVGHLVQSSLPGAGLVGGVTLAAHLSESPGKPVSNALWITMWMNSAACVLHADSMENFAF